MCFSKESLISSNMATELQELGVFDGLSHRKFLSLFNTIMLWLLNKLHFAITQLCFMAKNFIYNYSRNVIEYFTSCDGQFLLHKSTNPSDILTKTINSEPWTKIMSK